MKTRTKLLLLTFISCLYGAHGYGMQRLRSAAHNLLARLKPAATLENAHTLPTDFSMGADNAFVLISSDGIKFKVAQALAAHCIGITPPHDNVKTDVPFAISSKIISQCLVIIQEYEITMQRTENLTEEEMSRLLLQRNLFTCPTPAEYTELINALYKFLHNIHHPIMHGALVSYCYFLLKATQSPAVCINKIITDDIRPTILQHTMSKMLCALSGAIYWKENPFNAQSQHEADHYTPQGAQDFEAVGIPLSRILLREFTKEREDLVTEAEHNDYPLYIFPSQVRLNQMLQRKFVEFEQISPQERIALLGTDPYLATWLPKLPDGPFKQALINQFYITYGKAPIKEIREADGVTNIIEYPVTLSLNNWIGTATLKARLDSTATTHVLDLSNLGLTSLEGFKRLDPTVLSACTTVNLSYNNFTHINVLLSIPSRMRFDLQEIHLAHNKITTIDHRIIQLFICTYQEYKNDRLEQWLSNYQKLFDEADRLGDLANEQLLSQALQDRDRGFIHQDNSLFKRIDMLLKARITFESIVSFPENYALRILNLCDNPLHDESTLFPLGLLAWVIPNVMIVTHSNPAQPDVRGRITIIKQKRLIPFLWPTRASIEDISSGGIARTAKKMSPRNPHYQGPANDNPLFHPNAKPLGVGPWQPLPL